MTTFLLIRHAMCDSVGRSIAGRVAGIHLNEAGRRQAERLAHRLRDVALTAIYSSPLERALETAAPLATTQGLETQVLDGLNEIDFGEWTGKTLAELERVSVWRAFNTFRSGTRIPGGEHMAEVVSRALRDLAWVRELHPGPGSLVALISHGDVLRGLLSHSLGLPLDFMQRLELSPASISILSSEDHGNRVLQLNGTEDWPEEIGTRHSP
jgi:probable phosphomutase (TIGR03848 family)